ncbi:MAG TPA: hypothetical protein VFJ82_20490 [Longimicrobium sp.]|nr:hypothetical protein [Longimicrobium sp.]
MRSSSIRRAAFAAAACVFAAATARAQSAPGPVRDASLDGARMPVRVVLVRVADAPVSGAAVTMIDPSGEFARQVELSRPHLYASIPLSALLGVAGSVLGYGVGFVLLDCDDESPSCGQGPDNAEYFTAAAGLALGAAAGAHLGGLRRDSRGSLGLTLLGAAAGALPMVLVSREGDADTASLVSLAAAPAGAVLVDYLVRRPRH